MDRSTLCLLLLAPAFVGCKTTTTDCAVEPEADVCVESCRTDPTQSFCSPVDMGPPDMPTPVDMGPCGRDCGEQVCNTTSGECVDCLTEAECGGDTPVCLDNACVGCEDDGDCADPANGKCDTATNTCVPCDSSTQCTEDGAGVCDDGTCVECSASDESACGTNVCDVSAGTCTDIPEGGTGLCQECVSDRQCSPGRVCVPMTFDGTDVGNFCLWRLDATEVGGPNGSCTNSPPYRGSSTDITTIGGDSTSICTLRNTTCAALADFDTMGCTTPGDSDDQCGVAGLDDGLCRMVDAVVNRCTIPCDSDDDCRSGGCDLGETPPYCSF